VLCPLLDSAADSSQLIRVSKTRTSSSLSVCKEEEKLNPIERLYESPDDDEQQMQLFCIRLPK
jgi:hypothetical protein